MMHDLRVKAARWQDRRDKAWRLPPRSKRIDPKPDPQWLVCLHEAAHSIAADSLGMDVTHVSAVADKSTAGRAMIELDGPDALTVLYAGGCVTCPFCGYSKC